MVNTLESLKLILDDVETMAVVGASSKPQRDSYKVMKFLIENGFKVFPVNPNYLDHEILGEKCFSNLKDIDQKIDMVDIFRSKEFVIEIANDKLEDNKNGTLDLSIANPELRHAILERLKKILLFV